MQLDTTWQSLLWVTAFFDLFPWSTPESLKSTLIQLWFQRCLVRPVPEPFGNSEVYTGLFCFLLLWNSAYSVLPNQCHLSIFFIASKVCLQSIFICLLHQPSFLPVYLGFSLGHFPPVFLSAALLVTNSALIVWKSLYFTFVFWRMFSWL